MPSIAELGLSGYEAVLRHGLVGPAGLPDPIVERLNKKLQRPQRAAARINRDSVKKTCASRLVRAASARLPIPEALHVEKRTPRFHTGVANRSSVMNTPTL